MNRQHLLPRPDHTVHPVGRNQSRRPGQLQLELLRHYGLGHDSRLCEIGCGIGRLVYELADALDDGSYAGFDISDTAIRWLNDNYAPVLPNFTFVHVPAANDRYNPKGTSSARQVSFPFDAESFSHLCAFSVFTHMRFADIEHYLSEVRRVLEPTGRGVLTFFAIGPRDHEPALSDDKPFVRLDQHTWTTDRKLPERAIAFDQEHVAAAIRNCGLEISELRPGYWRDKSLQKQIEPSVHKDVYVVERA